MTTADVFPFDVRAESDFGYVPGQVVEISLVVDARPGG
ncbi:hypothetical protein C9F11_41380 [Streptomyces sp. YIM 121038]|nr:hypothetical protein C9F11_41380 [Streptomyces sp. YIM 121038]